MAEVFLGAAAYAAAALVVWAAVRTVVRLLTRPALRRTAPAAEEEVT